MNLILISFFVLSFTQTGYRTAAQGKIVVPSLFAPITATPSHQASMVKTEDQRHYFPFLIDTTDDGQFSISAYLDADSLRPYQTLFEKYDYTGNGYCWQSHIILMLEVLNPLLLEKIEFDCTDEVFLALAEDEETLMQFLETLNPIFSNQKKLEAWIQEADRDRISE